jgi:hypothetical protein
MVILPEQVAAKKGRQKADYCRIAHLFIKLAVNLHHLSTLAA